MVSVTKRGPPLNPLLGEEGNQKVCLSGNTVKAAKRSSMFFKLPFSVRRGTTRFEYQAKCQIEQFLAAEFLSSPPLLRRG